MAEYYYNQSFREPKKRRSLVMRIVDIFALAMSVMAFVAMMLLLFTPIINPARSWIFPIVGLFTPAIFIFAVLLALYWVIRWRWPYALMLIIPVIIALPRMSLYAQLQTSKEYETKATRGEFTVMSFNAKHFTNFEGKAVAELAKEYIEEQKPDIIAFQEYEEKRFKSAEQALERYNVAKVDNQAIWSRYKILDSSEQLIIKDSLESAGSAFWADIIISSDTIRLYNIHLHSTSITSSDNDYISSMEFLGDSLRDDRFIDMLRRFKETSQWRAKQAERVAQSIEESPYRVIVCGDFNDTPNSYAYHTLARGLNDTFAERGIGYAHTYRGFMNLLRIDYLLTEPSIEVKSYSVGYDYLHSDHYPVISKLKIK